MTKSIIITYQEADESFLMTFFKRFGVKTKQDNGGVPKRVADEIVVGFNTIKQYEQGEVDLEDAYDLAEQLRQEQDEEDTSDFWSPRKKTDITKLRGALKLNMTIEQIDSLTKNWRNEWERDFS
jgi:RNase H-fold protein (predicted Holliday junction resolvase)